MGSLRTGLEFPLSLSCLAVGLSRSRAIYPIQKRELRLKTRADVTLPVRSISVSKNFMDVIVLHKILLKHQYKIQ